MNRASIFIIIALLLLTCTKETTTPRPYPRVETDAVTDITSAGALFHGSITYTPANIIDYGFVWSTAVSPSFQYGNVVSLGSRSGTGSFSATASGGLAVGVKYYVCAYAKSTDYTVYGEVVSFVSLGSKAPAVVDFNPKTGSIGDTVLIKGKNFSQQLNLDVVQFSTTNANVILATDTTLKVIVPQGLTSITNSVSVSIFGNKATASSIFTLTLPQIVSADKSQVGICDTVTFTVMHLPNTSAQLGVIFNTVSVVPFSVVGNKIKAIVPFLPASTNSISLGLSFGGLPNASAITLNFLAPRFVSVTPASVGYLDTLTFKTANFPKCSFSIEMNGSVIYPYVQQPNLFKLIIPSSITSTTVDVKTFFNSNLLVESITPRAMTIQSFSPTSGTFDDIITINGAGFNPNPTLNSVCFNCNSTSYNPTTLQILTCSPRQITVKVPENFVGTLDWPVNIGVSTESLFATNNQTFTLNPPVISSITPSVITNQATVTVTGHNFNPIANNNSLSLVGSPSPLNILSATPTTLTFQANNAAISKDLDFSAQYLSALTLTVSDQSVTTSFSDSIKYAGPWTLKNNFPGASRTNGVSFSFGNKIYYGLGQDGINNPLGDFWVYNQTLDQWTQLADFPGTARTMCASWVVNNLGYVALGQGYNFNYLTDVWQFNPASNSWTQLADFPGNPSAGIAFLGDSDVGGAAVIGNQVYLGVGVNQFWKYDPTGATWTRLSDTPVSFYQIFTSKNVAYGLITSVNNSPSFVYQYDVPSDSWSTSQFTNPGGVGTIFFSAIGQGFYISNVFVPQYELIRMNDDSYFYSPFSFGNEPLAEFFLGSYIYFIMPNNQVYKLDLSLYPVSP